MSTYTVLPGTMNLAFKRSGDFSALVDFDVNLTGYTVSASLVSLVSSTVVQAFTTSVSDAAARADNRLYVRSNNRDVDNDDWSGSDFHRNWPSRYSVF